MDVIYNLIHVKRFGNMTHAEKLQVKEQGRPLPDITIETLGSSRGNHYKRHFKRDVYTRNDWICGCNRKNALFCFPCVLFGGEKSWVETGITDIVHLRLKMKKHENSRSHIYNQMEFALLGKVIVQAPLDSNYWQSIHEHNDDVVKNRYVLSKIINCIKFCGACELALPGHSEPTNPGLFREVVNFSAEFDAILHEHLRKATVFKATSEEIQNDLLDCIVEVCHEEIAREIDEAPFLALMVDETTDVSVKFQMVVVLRYVTQSGEPVERFWDFLLPPKHDAETLAQTILTLMDPLVKGVNIKLIAQTYDGAAAMSGQHGGAQVKIKEKYPNAYFVHGYAHELNLIMLKAASGNPQVRTFFGSLHDITGFFNHSSERVAVLDKVVRKVPDAAPTRWNFNIRTVDVVSEHRDSLIECMEELEKEYDQTISNQASAIRRVLQDPVFVFWLTFFRDAMSHVDTLFNQVQKRNIGSTEVAKATNVFEESMNNVRASIDTTVNEASNCDSTPEQQKKRRLDNSKIDHRTAALEICDIIVNTAIERLAFIIHLVAATLISSEKFMRYSGSFPDNELDLACSAYPTINKERLKVELAVIYSRSECRALRGAVSILKFLISNSLGETMGETKKLLQILLTTPVATAETERCFPTSKRIKSFLKNSKCEDHLTARSMLSVERGFISKMENFNERVIDKFAAKKDRPIPLMLIK